MTAGIELEHIIPTESQIQVLFDHLSMRTHHISHQNLPPFDAHKRFVQNNPYRAWFLIKEGGKTLGNIYVQNDNSLGLNNVEEIACNAIKNIIDLVYENLAPLDPIPSVRYKDFFFNIAIGNTKMMEKLDEIGFEPMKTTYVPSTSRRER